MKKLSDILYKAGLADVQGSTEIDISSVTADSREVTAGSLFVARKGLQSDGHDYIDAVVEAGAAAVVCETMPVSTSQYVTYVKVNDSAAALGQISANFYGNPSENLQLIGITGTNGKTTTATVLYELFRNLGFACGLISTVEIRINGEVIPTTHTTPDPVKLNSILSMMVREGCQYCFMEVSSHAIEQKRIQGLIYAGAVFTNISHDHLDYHKTFDNYIKAKKALFDSLPEDAFAVYNTDDRNGVIMIQETRARKKSFGLKGMADFRCKIIENTFSGLILNVDGHEVLCKLTGSFNAYNLLAAYSVAIMLEQDPLQVLTELSNIEPVEGRFQYTLSKNNVTGVIDYAHTPDALQNVLNTIKHIRTGNEKVITVVGCGGDRDPMKRPMMAKIACELSDKVVMTSDNPRSEDPEKILADMKKGVEPQHSGKVLSVVDRREAIRVACSLAASGDIILVAGKGHEKYQDIGGEKHPFDDMQVLQESFNIYES